jgi:hypothetical protein
LGFVYKRKGDLQKSMDCENRARLLLDEIWKRCQDEQFAYQTKDRSMFDDFDVLSGDSDFNFLQW